MPNPSGPWVVGGGEGILRMKGGAAKDDLRESLGGGRSEGLVYGNSVQARKENIMWREGKIICESGSELTGMRSKLARREVNR